MKYPSTSFFSLVFSVSIYFALSSLIAEPVRIITSVEAAAAAAAAAMTVSSGVPNRMLLSAKMECAQIGKALLTALQIDTTTTKEDGYVSTSSPSLTAENVIQSHTGTYGSICFVVRRPG